MSARTERKETGGGSFVEVVSNTTDSIELTRNAKGDYQWSIKAYYEPARASEALEHIGAIDAQLRVDYLKEEP